MKHPLRFLTLALTAIGVLAVFPGCAALNEMQSAQTEQTLSASGFKVVPANTPERAASLAQLKPYQIHRKIKGSTVYYLYPDPKQGVLYLGNQQQYNAYQGYTTQQEIANENLMASDMDAADSMGWSDWNIWGAGW